MIIIILSLTLFLLVSLVAVIVLLAYLDSRKKNEEEPAPEPAPEPVEPPAPVFEYLIRVLSYTTRRFNDYALVQNVASNLAFFNDENVIMNKSDYQLISSAGDRYNLNNDEAVELNYIMPKYLIVDGDISKVKYSNCKLVKIKAIDAVVEKLGYRLEVTNTLDLTKLIEDLENNNE